jgi:gamma-glutamyltranspeptidase/glutathione hydrolase
MAPTFTTRPELAGSFGMAASTHWLATATAMSVLERGGNAFDAAVAAALVLHVVEPHNNGPAGDVPILLRAGRNAPVQVLCGQGPAPAAATIAHYRAEGLDLVPRSGLLAAVVPGAIPAWLTLLRDHGTWTLADVAAPAIGYARDGWPVARATANAVAGTRVLFEQNWPTSCAYWLPGGQAPAPGARWRNPALAATWDRLLNAGAGTPDRAEQVERALRAWGEGFVAETIDRFVRTPVGDGIGHVHAGVLRAGDLAGYRPGYENPVSYDYGGWTVHKCGPWSQGPVLLQSLALLRQIGLDGIDVMGADFVHLVTEAMKLAYADRDTFYGDPAQVAVPLDVLLSDGYNRARAATIDLARAAVDYRPGWIEGFGRPLDYDAAVARQALARQWAARVSGEAAGSGPPRGDTCHLDVADRWGNVVSATPSGGWLQSSPHIGELGFPLGSRAQMFWLDEDHPSALGPGKRPRTTLTPSLATADGGATALAFGTPGGDGQDQWQLQFLLRLVHGGLGLQEAIDAPAFRSSHWPDSFWPRQAHPGRLIAESRFGPTVLDELTARGHRVAVADPWSEGSLSAVLSPADGFLRAAANPRGMQGYAAGR